MTRIHLLHVVEWLLVGIGTALGVWCAWVLIDAEYTRRMPIPPPLTIEQTLPGDAGSSPGPKASRAPAVVMPPPKPGSWVARLEAPSVDMQATVLEGSDDATLNRGAGHIEETALPGQLGNVGIAGHRDTTFRPLRNIQIGDPLNLTTRDRIYRFRITSTTIVGPKDVQVLAQTREPTLTLVTCYPFEFIGHAPRRFIVRARLEQEELRTP
jgi:sortase A